MKLCSVAFCENKSLARGLCGAHYYRLRTSGNVSAERPIRHFRSSISRCTIDGCVKPEYSGGVCTLHYQRKRAHGDAYTLLRQPNGSGSKNRSGYRLVYESGRQVLEHVAIAEAALCKPLPEEAEVHHVDGNPANNSNDNLVICPDHAYHMLLHRRQRAYEECVDANLLRCRICGNYDSADALYITDSNCHHRECKSLYQKRRKSCQQHSLSRS